MSFYAGYTGPPPPVTHSLPQDPYSLKEREYRRDSGQGGAKTTQLSECGRASTPYITLPIPPSQTSTRRRSAPPQTYQPQDQRSQRHHSHPSPTQPQIPEAPAQQPPSNTTALEPDTHQTFTSPRSTTHRLSQPPAPALPPPLKLTKYAVHDLGTDNALLSITRNAVHMPSHFSSKPLLSVLRSDTGHAVGSIRFHHLSTSAVDLELVGVGCSRLVRDGHFSKRWRFAALGGEGGATTTFFWCKSKFDGWELKEDGKKGVVVARLGLGDGLVLRFEKAGLDERGVEEIVLSAVAVVESLRRSQKENDWGE